MNILLAPDSFKGCLTSQEVCDAIEKGIWKFNNNINVMQFPSSDGGEGFCDCMRNIFGGEKVLTEVTYPLGNKGKASFAYNRESKTAYIELASASGLPLVPLDKRNILEASTVGTGELIRKAIKLGAENITVGLGGSATNDCGIGMLYALGMRFLDSAGFELKPCAKSLSRVAYAMKNRMIDLSDIKFTAACDVKNTLCGENGAAEIFSRQKGATEEEVKWLDKASAHFASAVGINPDLQGAGAAGGVGAAMLSVLNADYVSGAELLVGSDRFQDALSTADLLITGEGNTDAQTACGKLVSVVALAAKEKGIPAIVISGGLSEGYEELKHLGVNEFYSLTDEEHTVEYCISHAAELLAVKAYEIIKKQCAK